jgi:hypothetical protein
LPAVLTLFAVLCGCVESSMVARTRMDLEDELPEAQFEKEFAIRLGRLTTAFVKPVAFFDLEDEDQEEQILRRIHRVHFATYTVEDFPENLDGRSLASLDRRMQKQGWARMVRTREDQDLTWVYVRENKEEIRDLLVVVLAYDEMIIVRVGGRLDQMMADLIADDPSGFGASLGG